MIFNEKGKLLWQPGGVFVRLVVLCAAFCVAPIYPASPEGSLEVISQPSDPASATAAAKSPVPAEAPPPPAEIASDYLTIPPPLSEIRELPSASSASKAKQNYSMTELCRTVASVATANNLPIPFFANLIQQESGFKPHVVSPVGAQGIAQFMPRVATAYGLANPFDPIAALTASGKLLAELVGQFGNLGLAAAAYNAGPKRVQDWMAKRRRLPGETRHYVRNITGHAADQWAMQAKASELNLPSPARCADAVTSEADGSEPSKTIAQTVKIVAMPTRQAAFSKVLVHHSMPQPSQFAMGLPVSRFAAMATPLVPKKAQDRKSSRRAHLMSDHLDKAMKQFAAMATPVIMVETGSASHVRSTDRPKSKAGLKRLAAHTSDIQVRARRVRVAAAR